jgi:small GTP-binding protein
MALSKKVVILGDSGVGKTALLYRYIYDKFENSSMPTIGTSFKSKTLSIPGEGDIKLNLWDTAG